MDAGDITAIMEKADEYYEEEIKKLIENEANNVLDDMFSEGGFAREQIVSWIQDGVLEAVYGSYTPKLYDRRGLSEGSGGIGDPENIIINYGYKNKHILVDYEDVATGNSAFSPTDRMLETIILSGNGYHYPEVGMGYFASPRDFYCVLDEEWGDGSFFLDYLESVVSDKISDMVDSLYISCITRAYNEFMGV